MNTTLKVTIAIVAVIAVVAIVGAGFAFAQGLTPWGGYGMMGNQGGMMSGYATQNGTPVPGFGGMNGQGGMGAMGSMMNMMTTMNGVDMNAMHQWMSDTNGVHNIVWGGLAEALNLTPDELNAQLASGQTLTQIAVAQGVSPEQLTTILETSMKAGLDQAVADGVFTREQADRMLTQMSGQYQWMITQMGAGMGFGNGNCHGNLAQ